MEWQEHFKPRDLLKARKGTLIETCILIDKAWSNEKMWGISAQARNQVGFRFPPPKEYRLEKQVYRESKWRDSVGRGRGDRKRSRSRERSRDRSSRGGDKYYRRK